MCLHNKILMPDGDSILHLKWMNEWIKILKSQIESLSLASKEIKNFLNFK